MSLNTTEIFQVNSLAGPGIGFASIDANENLFRTTFPNDPYQVLTGNEEESDSKAMFYFFSLLLFET